jgi:carboxyl-terminal processing protease
MSDDTDRKDRNVPWMTISGVLTIFLILLLFSPTLVAQTLDQRSQRLLSTFQYIFSFVQNNYVDPVDAEKLVEGALKGMFESLEDPHSAYLSSTDMRSLGDTTAGEFGGVGLYINKQVQPKAPDGRELPSYVEVVAPIEDTPAYKAGIQAGDLIVKIEGESTEKLAIDEVVNRLRGRAGSVVTVTVTRGGGLSFDVPLTRAVIQVPTVKWTMMPGGIGYLRIIQFTPYTDDKTREAIEFFQTQNYSKMVVDLRSNPGGLLSSVVETADMFFDGGPIVSTKSRISAENTVFEARPGTLVPPGLPIAVLIDNGSASASEIFAGVMKDRQRAVLFGTKTYGKGSVQQVHTVGKGGFRLTMSRYYTPSGVTIDKVGVSPDREVKEPEMSEAELAAYSKIVSDRRIPEFIKNTPAPTEENILSFVNGLLREDAALSERVLRRMVRNEINRHLTNPPIYDLEYDRVLQEAFKFLSEKGR